MKQIIAIDPGNIESAYVLLDADTYKAMEFGKVTNDEMLENIKRYEHMRPRIVIEMITSYGMPVGAEVFDTVVWIGRFFQSAKGYGLDITLLGRRYVKLNLCNSSRAKDANVIQALKDRFGDKGKKANPGWFYGFKADIWQAYALGVTFIDEQRLMSAEQQKAREAIALP